MMCMGGEQQNETAASSYLKDKDASAKGNGKNFRNLQKSLDKSWAGWYSIKAVTSDRPKKRRETRNKSKDLKKGLDKLLGMC